MSSTATEYRADALTRVEDVDLIDTTYDAVDGLHGEGRDDLYFLLQEVFERFAPRATYQAAEFANVDGEAGIARLAESMGRRHVARLRAAGLFTDVLEERPLEEIAAELTAWMRGLSEGLQAALDESDARREVGSSA